jgi:signal transduction histidine kinase/ActR/RegA family two-component response regulator
MAPQHRVTEPRVENTYATFQQSDNNDLTLADLLGLVQSSSAGIAFLSFSTPISLDVDSRSFADLLYSAPSTCLQVNQSFAQSRSYDSPAPLLGKSLETLFPARLGFKEMFEHWHRHNLTREGFEWHTADSVGRPVTQHVACYAHCVNKALLRVWIITRDISAMIQAIRANARNENHFRGLLNQPGVLFLRVYTDGTVSFCTNETKKALDLEIAAIQTIDEILSPRCHPEDREALQRLAFKRHQLSLDQARESIQLVGQRAGLRRYVLNQIPHYTGDEIDYYDIIGLQAGNAPSAPPSFLASGLAHDANNHLFIATAHIQNAERSLGESHPVTTSLRAALSAISQSSEIYNQAMMLEAGIAPLLTEIDVGMFFEEVVSQVCAIMPVDIALTTTVKPGAIHVRADRIHLRQILTNLILNARDALGRTGNITLSATIRGRDPTIGCPIQESEVVVISVSDNGPGIDPSILQTVFTPFFSTKKSSTPRGLGLAMVKTLIERNHGQVSATSAEGIGTTFTLCLPASSSGPRESAQPTRCAPHPIRPLAVLIADDDANIREVFREALFVRGHSPTVCENGETLLIALENSPRVFDAVIIDEDMPGTSGPELLKAIHAKRPRMPIILTSGDPLAAQRLTEDNHQCTFLPKPCTFEALYHTVETFVATMRPTDRLITVRRKRHKIPSE